MSKVIVFVHGAGKYKKDYYKEALAALTALLGSEPQAVGVWFSDLAEVGTPVSMTRRRNRAHTELDGEEVSNFKAAFAMLVQSDLNALPQYERHTAAFTMPAQFLAEIIATDLNQVAAYLFSSKIYNAVQTRMRDALNHALGMGDEIVIASHSLGSIVAFDALRETAANSNVSSFFTLGSPLSKLRRLNLRTSDLGAIPGNVGEWLNLYDTTDPVANALGPVFPSRPFRLRDIFVDVDSDPIRSHDYFHNEETLTELAGAML
ncbi:MAG TPA: hypothetical protein VFD70_20065 [Anaerolineae bacterium]|nr:hypothetical protein [Anaerolineae bacterium]